MRLNDFLAIKNDTLEELHILEVGLTRMETCYQVFMSTSLECTAQLTHIVSNTPSDHFYSD